MNNSANRHPVPPGGYTAARRDAIRRFHPDTGGDPHVLIEALSRIDAMYGSAAPSAGEKIVVGVQRSGIFCPVRWTQVPRAVRRLRAALPRSWPGARRYGTI
jgi:hypothetical protein